MIFGWTWYFKIVSNLQFRNTTRGIYAKYYYKSCYFVKQRKKMEAMKNVRGAHVFDLKLLKAFFYLVFGIYNKNSFDSRIIYRWGKYHKKTIWPILLGVRLLRINTDQMTSSPEMRKWFRWFIPLGLVEGKCSSKSYVSHLWHLLRYMFVDELQMM